MSQQGAGVTSSPQGSPSHKPKEKKPRAICPHKKTDFRYEIWVKERKALKQKARKNSFRVDTVNPHVKAGAVTVDTSKARSNLHLVRMCLIELGWREFPLGKRDGGYCDIHWHGGTFGNDTDYCGGKVNKFPNAHEITRKVNLCRTLDIMHKMFPDDYDFHPKSWFLPQQFAEFSDHVRREHDKKKKPVYIVKPDEGSQGDGIYLIREPKDYYFNNKYHVVQEYLADPLLIEDTKFDLRIYVVLKCVDPLEIYIYDEGLARFCTVPYEPPTQKNLHEHYMHLTNYSLNKHSSGYQHTENDDDGSKRTMSSVFKKLRHRGYDTEKLWDEIQRMVAKTVIAITSELIVELRAQIPPGKPGPSCFQILGFDIMIMKDLTPMLLEVNSAPSLRIDYEHEIAIGISEYLHSPLDEEIKRPLVMKTLLLMAPKGKLRSQKRRSKSGKKDTSDSGTDTDTDQEVEFDINKACPGGSLECIYPEPFADLYEETRVLERMVEIFLHALGVRGCLRMGPTAFRNFIRRCHLQSGAPGFTSADFDIMYIDLQRRWQYMNPDCVTGLCYQGFLEAFMQLANKKFPSNRIMESVEQMLDHCENYLAFGPDHRPKPGVLPKLTKHDKKLDELKAMYAGNNRKTVGNSYFIDYKKSPVEIDRRPRRVQKSRFHVKDGKHITLQNSINQQEAE